MNKRLIYYSTFVSRKPQVGKSAAVVACFHPDPSKNGKMCVTSTIKEVIHIIDDYRPVFETLNSVYVPCRRDSVPLNQGIKTCGC